MKKILIISDGKPGHLNQSIAFCRLKKIDYDIVGVCFKTKAHKLLSYFLDRVGIYTKMLYRRYDFRLSDKSATYKAIVSTGSSTYYFNNYLSKAIGVPSIVLMYPKGYCTRNFDFIIAQSHDRFRSAKNIIEIPLNLSFLESTSTYFVTRDERQPALAIVLGGSNNVFTMSPELIRNKLDEIFTRYPGYLKYVTTSRRTSGEVEKVLERYHFDYTLIYSEQPNINPISDFVTCCDMFFITIDSTSMISEIRANSDAKIEIIDLYSEKKNTKYHRLVDSINEIDGKVDFNQYLEKIRI